MQYPCLDDYMMMAGHCELLETALKNQEKIGLNYAIRGYLSTSWVDSEQYVNCQPHDGIQQTWLHTIIKTFWWFNKTMETHQNSVLHSKSSRGVLSIPKSAPSSNSNRIFQFWTMLFLTPPWRYCLKDLYDPRSAGFA
jgi:hypothetical protein